MKIVVLDHPRIVNPARAEDVVNAPLSSCMFTGYVAAMLHSGGFDVDLVDANLRGWTCAQTVAHVCALRPNLVAVNLVYMWDETAQALEMLRRIKERLPDVHVSVFGYYPTFAFEFLLKGCEGIDSVIVGEPEHTALELAQRLAARQEWRKTRGIACRRGEGVRRNEVRPLIEDLDGMPFPFRTERRLREARRVSPYVLGSRGCYNQCSFCYLNPFYGAGARWRGRTPENILRELRGLKEKDGLEYLYFADANFFGPGKPGRERALRMAELVRRELPGVAFGLECRANDVHEETMQALRAAGLRDVFLGVESGSDKTLSRLGKHLSAETNARAIRILRDLGIHTSYGFIMFDPDSTLEEVRESFEFLKANGLLDEACVTAHLLHHRARVLAATPLFRSVGGRAGSDLSAFGGYECAYRIEDEGADLLARCCTPVLLKILQAGDGRRGKELNQAAIDCFESCLGAIEKGALA